MRAENFNVQVTTDIHDDVERQNLTLDETVETCPIPALRSCISQYDFNKGNSFTGVAGSLAQSSRRAVHAFGSTGPLKQYRLLVWMVGIVVGLWLLWHLFGWIKPSSSANV